MISFLQAFNFATWGWQTEVKLIALASVALFGVILFKPREVETVLEDLFSASLDAEPQSDMGSGPSPYRSAIPILNFISGAKNVRPKCADSTIDTDCAVA